MPDGSCAGRKVAINMGREEVRERLIEWLLEDVGVRRFVYIAVEWR